MKFLRCLFISGFVGLTMMLSTAAMATADASTMKATQSIKPDIQRLRKLFTDNNRKNIRLLFIQQAKAASLVKNSNKSGCYTLTLTKLHPRVLYFTDQPRKLAGHLSVASFLYILENNQSHFNIKPNVAIEGFTDKKPHQETMIVLNLSSPKYSGTGRHQKVSYTACPLRRNNNIKPMKLKKLKFIL